MANARPDLIIAIDLGMTCTGVAYINQSIGSDTIRWIQKWPGRQQSNENKVPTMLVYTNNQEAPSSWGFLADTKTEQSAEDKETIEWFKTYLDENELRQRHMTVKDTSVLPSSVWLVEKWYLDYFRLLYQYIEAKLQTEIPINWHDARVEFIFSVPTTWRNPTVERFRFITEKAGFGRHTNHTSVIGLTEAEAAAVHMAKESPAVFSERDILLVCDAGGGANLGSAQIDAAFQNSIHSLLVQADRIGSLGFDIHDASWEMMKSREYQNAKCDYGAPDDTDFFSVAIPGLSKRYTNERFGIFDGEMRIPRDNLKRFFDTQIIELFSLIDRQLESLRLKLPNEQVSHLVLSGGLGNSLYIQKRLVSRYADGSSPFPNTTRLQVRVAPDPQLVVCKGIVADRLQKLKSGVGVLGWRCCRASYGTMYKVEYDPTNVNHLNQPTANDAADGKIYVVGVVDWFIKQGEPVSADQPIVRNFRQKIGFKDPDRVFSAIVVESLVDKHMLPYTFNSNCTKLCNVQSDFSSIELTKFKLKNRRFWNSGKKYYRADYIIKVVLGPADIKFELWFDGQKLSKDESIKVEWVSAPAPVVVVPPVEIDSYLQPTMSPIPSPPIGGWDFKAGMVSVTNLVGGPRKVY